MFLKLWYTLLSQLGWSGNQFSFCEGVIIYRIMIIYTHFCSNPVLFNYVNEDSRFFICWYNVQLSSVSLRYPSEVLIRRSRIRSTSVRRSADSYTQELHRMMVINYEVEFFYQVQRAVLVLFVPWLFTALDGFTRPMKDPRHVS